MCYAAYSRLEPIMFCKINAFEQYSKTFPIDAQLCVLLCSKYAHIKVCLDCSITVSVNILLGYISTCRDCSIRAYPSFIIIFPSQHSCKFYFYCGCTLSYSASCEIGRVSTSLITNTQKLCLLYWHCTQCFGYLLCPKLCGAGLVYRR